MVTKRKKLGRPKKVRFSGPAMVTKRKKLGRPNKVRFSGPAMEIKNTAEHDYSYELDRYKTELEDYKKTFANANYGMSGATCLSFGDYPKKRNEIVEGIGTFLSVFGFVVFIISFWLTGWEILRAMSTGVFLMVIGKVFRRNEKW
jgi:hypothetical protein